MNTSRHLLFLLSALLITVIAVISMFTSYHQFTVTIIIILKYYSVPFFLISSYFVFRFRKFEFKSGLDRFLIRHGYPAEATILFAWLFLLPVMRDTVGMWDSEALNMFVTLALSNFVFFLLIGIYMIAYHFFGKKDSSLNAT